MNKKILFKLLPSLIVLLLFVLVGEAVVRMAGLSMGWNSIKALEAFKRSNPFPPYSIGYTYVSDTSFFNIRGELYEINSDGFRDREHSRQKPRGKKRLLFIGDSVTEGIGVKSKDRFTEKLGLARYEVFNMGIARYNTFDALAVVQRYAPGYDPDHILVQVCENDVASKPRSDTTIDRRPAKKTFFQANSALYLYFAEIYNALKLKHGGQNSLTENLLMKKEKQFQISFANLKRIANICKNLNIEMSLMYVPIHAEVLMQDERQADRMNRRFREFCEAQNIRNIDVLKVLRENESEKLYIDHGHLTPLGHSIVAKQIRKELTQD